MAVVGKPDWSRCVEVIDMVASELALPQSELVLFGGALRDLYFGVEPNDWDIFVPVTDVRSLIGLMSLARKYPDLNVDVAAVSDNAYVSGSYDLGHLELHGLDINLVSGLWFSPHVYDWDVNRAWAKSTGFVAMEHTLIIAAAKGTIEVKKSAVKSGEQNPSKLLRRGVKIEQRLGLKMSPESVSLLLAHGATYNDEPEDM